MTLSSDDILARTAHRPWPLPSGPWIMGQSWHDVLFAHWPVPAAALAGLLPDTLEVDTWNDSGWIGVVPFHMTGVKLRGLPTLPGTSAFPEINVRTYVRPRPGRAGHDRPGVWFFSLDAQQPLAVRTARTWFGLPYYDALFNRRDDGDDGIAYASRRTHRDAPAADFRARYGPTGDVLLAAPDSFDAWLTERYCLYAQKPKGPLKIGEIHHEPWPLQPAFAQIELNTMTQAAGIELPHVKPVLHFARQVDVRVWAPRVVQRSVNR